ALGQETLLLAADRDHHAEHQSHGHRYPAHSVYPARRRRPASVAGGRRSWNVLCVLTLTEPCGAAQRRSCRDAFSYIGTPRMRIQETFAGCAERSDQEEGSGELPADGKGGGSGTVEHWGRLAARTLPPCAAGVGEPYPSPSHHTTRSIFSRPCPFC